MNATSYARHFLLVKIEIAMTVGILPQLMLLLLANMCYNRTLSAVLNLVFAS